MSSSYHQPWRDSGGYSDPRGSRHYSSNDTRYSNSRASNHSSRDALTGQYPRSNYKRRRWPPNPSVEDESDAIAKEYPPRKIRDTDVQNRGEIGQEPILEQLVSLDTRFVLVSDPAAKYSPAHDDLKSKKVRKRKPRNSNAPELKVETSDPIPILERRKPSPYSFSKTQTGRMTNAEFFLSPDSGAPLATTSMPRSMPNEDGFKSMKEQARKDSSMTSESTANRSDSSEESEAERRALKNRSIHGSRSARTSSTDLPGMHARHLSFGGSQQRDEKMRTSLNPPSSQSDYFSDATRPQRPSSRNLAPGPTSVGPTSAGPMKGSDETRYWETRHTSIPGPPSPMIGVGARTPRGRDSPRSGSRPDSPSSPWEPFPYEAPKSPYDPIPEYDLLIHSKPKPLSRLSSMNSAYADDPLAIPRIDVQGPSPARTGGLSYPNSDQKRGGSNLPYPEEDHPMAMPDQYQFMSMPPEPSAPPSKPSTRSSDSYKEPQNSTGPRSAPKSQAQPSLNRSGSSRSSVERAQSSAKVPSTSGARAPNFPPCPRRRFSKQYDDWYYLMGCKDFDVCPSCYNLIIKNSQFRDYFERGNNHPQGAAVRCDFGSLWIRLAWLVMAKQQQMDMNLIYDLATTTKEHSRCPENDHVVGTWYGILDRRLNFVDNFFVCPRDKASLDIIFPSLRESFVRVPSSRIPAICALRAESRRLPTYIDVFDAINDAALRKYDKSLTMTRNPPPLTNHTDVTPLISLATDLSRNIECPRDRATPNLLWHFIPDVPDLTVCPECYTDIIAPEASEGLPLALAFTSTPRPVPQAIVAMNLAPGAVHGMPDGFTCCLYSERMRSEFDRAAESTDGVIRWVAIAQDRRKREFELGARKAELLRMAGSVRSELLRRTDSMSVKRELDKVEEEWEKWQ